MNGQMIVLWIFLGLGIVGMSASFLLAGPFDLVPVLAAISGGLFTGGWIGINADNWLKQEKT